MKNKASNNSVKVSVVRSAASFTTRNYICLVVERANGETEVILVPK